MHEPVHRRESVAGTVFDYKNGKKGFFCVANYFSAGNYYKQVHLGYNMGDDIQIEPMKWGTCSNCKGSIDEMGGPILVFSKSNPDDLKGIHCKDCLYVLWGV